MQTRTQKIISLVLVLVMLVSMVPMGIFSVSAEDEAVVEPSAELVAGLADYANTTEFVINNVADWEAISAIPAADKVTFGGKTVKLGGDIDFGGATVNTLFAYNFYGTFDGQGYTLKNANVVSEAGNAGFLFRQLDGGLVTDVVIDNVTVTNNSTVATDRTGVLSGYASTWADLTVTKVTIKNSIAKTTATTAPVGLLFGCHYNNGQVVNFNKIALDGQVVSAQSTNVGGVVGEVNVKASATTWTNIESNVSVVTNKTTPATYLGGFAGLYIAEAGRSANISNVYVGGSIADENVSSASHGGFVGQFRGTAGQDLGGINNILLAVNLTAMCGNSVTFANCWNGNVVYTNVYSITKSNSGTWSSTTQRWTGMSNNDSSFFNGVKSAWTSADPIQNSMTYISKLQAYMMIVRDADGFMNGVNTSYTPSGLAADLLAYTKSEYVIDSVEDWTLVSMSGHDFKNKTVKLGADIDFKGAKAPILFTAGSFYGTFDGQGYTIKNAVVTELGNAALFTAKIGGGKITNVNIDNVTVNGNGYAGLVAAFSSVYANLEISKINATNITINNAGNATGGIIGQLANKGYAAVLTQINLQGAVNYTGTAAAYVGGFFGEASFTAVGTAQFSKIVSDVDVVAPSTANVAAFGGYYTLIAGTFADFDDIKVGGSVVDNYANTAWTAGFVCKFAGVAGETCATVNNVLLAADMTAATGNAITFAGVHNGNLVYENVYSVTKSNGGVHNTTTVRWTGMSHNDSSFFNGVKAAWTSADPIQNTLTYVSQLEIQGMVKKDSNGFVTSISAPVLEGLAGDLMAYTKTEYVINSVEDWTLVSQSGHDFNGKIVKLGSNIDFKGAKAPILFTAGSFYGTFDGQGYTIKNAVVTEASNAALFTAKIGGGKVTNVNIDNVTINANGYAGLVAGFSSVYAPLEISKINATNITINNAGGSTGGIIGSLTNKGYNADFKQINISGAINYTGASDAGAVGGVFGDASFAVNTTGTVAYAQIKVAMAIDATTGTYMGGFGGSYTVRTGASYTVDDLYVGGSLNDNGGSSHYVGAVIGYNAGVVGVEIAQYNNVVIAVDMSKAVNNSTIWGTVENGKLIYNNVFSTVKSNGGVKTATMPRWTAMSINANSFVNDVYAAWASTDPLFDTMVYVDAAKAATLVKTDAAGFIASVMDHIDAEAVQVGAVAGGKYAVRFIAMSQLAEATNVNMVVIATYTDGTGTHSIKFDSSKSTTGECKLYDGLTVYDQYGIADKTVFAEDYNAEKLAGFTIYNIPTGNAITFEVTTSYVNALGATVEGTNTMTVSFDANGALVK